MPLLDTALRHILDAMSDGVYVTTADREIVFWNEGAERITGYATEEVVGRHCYDDILVHTDLEGHKLCFDGCPLRKCIETHMDRAVNEVFLKRKDGKRLAVYIKTSTFEQAGETYGVEVFGELGSVAGEDLAARVQELSDSSVTDSLTGLFNRRYFDAALEQNFALYQRLGRRFGVVFLDIDEFKAVNDTHGHVAGDEAIRFLAGVIRSNARKMDIAARYGGDEFAIVCAVSSSAELDAYCRRLMAMLRDSVFTLGDDVRLTLTVSAGASMVDRDDADERAVLVRADSGLYQSKRAGRDRHSVVLAPAGISGAATPLA